MAIKFLHASLCEDGEYRTRFLREARAAGVLSHPNIVTVHDVGEIEGRPYMAMELLTGVVLSETMESGTQLPVRDVVVMGIQLARALHYAHAHGVVHRDIKPGNIVRLTGTQTIKVTDFGIARIESGSPSRAPAWVTCWARRNTCRPSRRRAKRSMVAPISSPPASCCTRC